MIYLIGFVLMVVCGILEGWVFSVMWGWFIVPVFGAPALRIPHAIGLALVVGMLTHRVRKEQNQPDTVEILAYGLVMPFVYLGIGWVVKLFV